MMAHAGKQLMEGKVDKFELTLRACPVDRMGPSFRAYLEHGRPMGGFAMAMLRGDLFTASVMADVENARNLHSTARWIDNYFPHDSYGSQEKVDDWMKKGGLKGKT